jgi:GNAT superfamily N-acetyltransferase
METKTVTVFHLEMFAPPGRTVDPPRKNLNVVHVPFPTIMYYRSLYDPIGEDYNWRRRRKMTSEQLLSIIGDERVEIHVLHVDGEPAGFAELDRRQEDEVELVQFGLMPAFIGQGLGKWFLNWVVEKSWSYKPRRVWVHTCTLDHTAALPNYLSAGFKLFKQEVIQQPIG